MTTKPLRVFRVYFQCEECPNEFMDEMLTVSSSYCPCCDAEIQPYASEATFEEVEDDAEEEVA